MHQRRHESSEINFLCNWSLHELNLSTYIQFKKLHLVTKMMFRMKMSLSVESLCFSSFPDIQCRNWLIWVTLMLSREPPQFLTICPKYSKLVNDKATNPEYKCLSDAIPMSFNIDCIWFALLEIVGWLDLIFRHYIVIILASQVSNP